jgi:carbon-monoxide dehydrogenase large subunit
VSPETVLVAWAALELGRPVKWVEDRRENLLASYQGRGMVAEV